MYKSLLTAIMLTLTSLAGAAAEEKRIWKKGDLWPYPKIELRDVIVFPGVIYQKGVFSYSYKLVTSSRTALPIARFEVDLRDIPEVHPLLRSDLTSLHDSNAHTQVLLSAQKAHPVRKINPLGWDFEQASKLSQMEGIWGAEQDGLVENTTITPGTALSGFGMDALEPPGIREYTVDADLSVREYKYQLCETAEQCNYYYFSPDYKIEYEKGIQYLGKTIAPVKPPEPFAISSWTTRMATDGVEARKLKWIKTDKNLQEIKKLISDLNTKELTNLSVAVRKIERYVLAEKAKGNFTDEADALIRLNAQYLLRRAEKIGEAGE